ncbi:hypothetical protein K439DRAFT_1636136, partial [Ramaria rubella]
LQMPAAFETTKHKICICERYCQGQKEVAVSTWYKHSVHRVPEVVVPVFFPAGLGAPGNEGRERVPSLSGEDSETSSACSALSRSLFPSRWVTFLALNWLFVAVILIEETVNLVTCVTTRVSPFPSDHHGTARRACFPWGLIYINFTVTQTNHLALA